jgi:hypothetical protein
MPNSGPCWFILLCPWPARFCKPKEPLISWNYPVRTCGMVHGKLSLNLEPELICLIGSKQNFYILQKLLY